jgi:hypothetical protein
MLFLVLLACFAASAGDEPEVNVYACTTVAFSPTAALIDGLRMDCRTSLGSGEYDYSTCCPEGLEPIGVNAANEVVCLGC